MGKLPIDIVELINQISHVRVITKSRFGDSKEVVGAHLTLSPYDLTVLNRWAKDHPEYLEQAVAQCNNVPGPFDDLYGGYSSTIGQHYANAYTWARANAVTLPRGRRDVYHFHPSACWQVAQLYQDPALQGDNDKVLLAYARSCNALFGLIADTLYWSLVAPDHFLYLNFGSLHIYKKDFDLIKEFV